MLKNAKAVGESFFLEVAAAQVERDLPEVRVQLGGFFEELAGLADSRQLPGKALKRLAETTEFLRMLVWIGHLGTRGSHGCLVTLLPGLPFVLLQKTTKAFTR
jgi:hypothetical protein